VIVLIIRTYHSEINVIYVNPNEVQTYTLEMKIFLSLSTELIDEILMWRPSK